MIMVQNNSVILIAHRGSTTSTIKENTLKAFRRAVKLGADMIETDIRQTKDHQLVCAHNPDWNGRLLKDMSYQEWKEEAERTEGWTPALLSDLFPLLKEGVRMNIEIKERGIEQQIMQDVPKISGIIFSSFEEDIIKKVKTIDKKARTALIVGQSLFFNPKKKALTYLQDYFPEKRLKAAQADIICPHYRMASARFIQRMHRRGYEVYVWTINEPERWKKFITSGADAIFTDEIPMGRYFRG